MACIPLLRVKDISRRERIPLASSRWYRVLATPLLSRHVAALQELAEGANIPRHLMLGRIACAALEDGGKPARRLLGKQTNGRADYLLLDRKKRPL